MAAPQPSNGWLILSIEDEHPWPSRLPPVRPLPVPNAAAGPRRRWAVLARLLVRLWWAAWQRLLGVADAFESTERSPEAKRRALILEDEGFGTAGR